jgi:hypothetical protein
MIYGQLPDDREQQVESSIGVMTNGMTLFNVLGDIEIIDLWSECQTANGLTASTLQYAATVTGLAQQTLSGVSAALTSAAVGTVVALDGTSLVTAPNVYTTGVGLGQTSRSINMLNGVIQAIIAVGSTTGTWKHYLRYRPLSNGATAVGV